MIRRLLGISSSLINFRELSFFFSKVVVCLRQIVPNLIMCWLSALCCNMMTVLNDSSSGVRLGIFEFELAEVCMCFVFFCGDVYVLAVFVGAF